MKKNACEICGRVGKPDRDLAIHQIIPEEVASQAGVVEVRRVLLCIDCSCQVQTWCNRKVSAVSYDNGAKRFVPRLPSDMVKEYEIAYGAFAEYKKRLQHTT